MLYKTTIVIWTEYDPTLRFNSDNGSEPIADLAREAVDGDAYCSKADTVPVGDPKADPDWDGTEFFEPPLNIEPCYHDGSIASNPFVTRAPIARAIVTAL